MERLTVSKNPMCEVEYCNHENCMSCWGMKVTKKLAAYEDRGIAPENVLTGRELAETACAIIVLKKYQDIGTVEDFAALKKERELRELRPEHEIIENAGKFVDALEVAQKEATHD